VIWRRHLHIEDSPWTHTVAALAKKSDRVRNVLHDVGAHDDIERLPSEALFRKVTLLDLHCPGLPGISAEPPVWLDPASPPSPFPEQSQQEPSAAPDIQHGRRTARRREFPVNKREPPMSSSDLTLDVIRRGRLRSEVLSQSNKLLWVQGVELLLIELGILKRMTTSTTHHEPISLRRAEVGRQGIFAGPR